MQSLEGVKVLDLTRVLAGPFSTMILADLGAEVIKVESLEGDEARGFGPFKNEVSGYFQNVNRGKKSIALNLKDPTGREILLKLISEVDILVENFRPGAMKRLGLDYPSLQPEFPTLIYAACSGFGQTGPYAERGAYDMIIQGMGGVISITGEPDRPPVRVGVSIGDLSAALYTCIGILTALFVRNQTGKGQMVDISMLDCQVALLENAIARYDMTGEIPQPLGARHPSITPFQALKTKDNWIMVAAGNNNLWAKFCEAIGCHEMVHDHRFESNELRTENHQALQLELEKVFITKDTLDWLEILGSLDIPCGPIQSVDQVVEDPQILARNMILTMVHPVAGPLRMSGSPINLSETQPSITQHAPDLGEHTNHLLHSYINASEDEITKWRKDGIIQ